MGATKPIEEVTAFARKVAAFAKVAVASGGYLPVVLKTLEVIGFKDFFPVVVTSEQVSRVSRSRTYSLKPQGAWAYRPTNVWCLKIVPPVLKPLKQREWITILSASREVAKRGKAKRRKGEWVKGRIGETARSGGRRGAALERQLNDLVVILSGARKAK